MSIRSSARAGVGMTLLRYPMRHGITATSYQVKRLLDELPSRAVTKADIAAAHKWLDCNPPIPHPPCPVPAPLPLGRSAGPGGASVWARYAAYLRGTLQSPKAASSSCRQCNSDRPRASPCVAGVSAFRR